MTVGAWLRSREPSPPEALSQRIVAALGADALRDAREADVVCLDAAVRVLEPLLRDTQPGRASALDLLAADALVTYAFEAAGGVMDTLDAKTADAMARLAELAGREARTVA